jgi:hypothetical protein
MKSRSKYSDDWSNKQVDAQWQATATATNNQIARKWAAKPPIKGLRSLTIIKRQEASG